MENQDFLNARRNQEQEGNSTKQFLTFTVDDEEYGVDIIKVMEIRGWQETTKMPDSPKYMKGVIDLRGIVVPIFDLKRRFDNGDTEIDALKVVVVLNIGIKTIGILVDGVSDILTVDKAEIKDSPSANTESQVSREYIAGLISKDDGMIIVLDVERLFEKEVIARVTGQQ